MRRIVPGIFGMRSIVLLGCDELFLAHLYLEVSAGSMVRSFPVLVHSLRTPLSRHFSSCSALLFSQTLFRMDPWQKYASALAIERNQAILELNEALAQRDEDKDTIEELKRTVRELRNNIRRLQSTIRDRDAVINQLRTQLWVHNANDPLSSA